MNIAAQPVLHPSYFHSTIHRISSSSTSIAGRSFYFFAQYLITQTCCGNNQSRLKNVKENKKKKNSTFLVHHIIQTALPSNDILSRACVLILLPPFQSMGTHQAQCALLSGACPAPAPPPASRAFLENRPVLPPPRRRFQNGRLRPALRSASWYRCKPLSSVYQPDREPLLLSLPLGSGRAGQKRQNKTHTHTYTQRNGSKKSLPCPPAESKPCRNSAAAAAAANTAAANTAAAGRSC